MNEMNGNNNQNNQKKAFPVKIAVISAVVAFVLILAAAGVAIVILLGREKPAEPTPEFGMNIKNEINPTKDTEPQESEGIEVSNLNSLRVEIVPTRNTPDGIETDTEFIIKTSVAAKISDLIKRITVKGAEEETAYDLRESNTAGEYIMTLAAPLEYDSIYRIEYTDGISKPVSFAFQTVENFKVITTTPGKETYDIPLNSGIEITFNEKIGGDFKDYFEITPYVHGKFDSVGNTYIFIPDELMSGTNYTVTVKGGLHSGETVKIMQEDYTFSFWTQWADNADYVNISGNAYETFLSDDEIFVELSVRGVFSEKSYKVETYKLNTPEEYLNAAKYRDLAESESQSLADFSCISSIETELLNIEINNYYSLSYIMLNQTLPDGWYIIKISTENDGKIYDLYKFIQVSPLSVYSASIDGETLFWVNDTKTGLPAKGAQIIMMDTDHGSTAADGDGLAKIDTIKSANNTSVIIKHENYPEFVYTTSLRAPADLNMRSRYYNYVYTDRRAYRPNDSIDVFGVIRERYGEYKITEDDEITLEIGNMIKIPVTLDKYGSFDVKIPIKDLTGYLNINLCLNGEIITQTYINIVDYDNAKYAVDAATDRFTYRPGESAEVTITAEYYDGTAAEGVEVTARTNEMISIGATDSDGVLKTTEYVNKSTWSNQWQPYNSTFYYNIGKTENKIQYIYVPYVVIPSDIMLEYKVTSEKNGNISFTSNFINRDAIEKSLEESFYYVYSLQPDLYRGDSADIDFTLEIHKYETTRTKTGERYDYINKINVPIYEYRTSDTIYETHDLKTVNGKTTVRGLPVSDDMYINYYAIVRYNDTDGNPVEFTLWYRGYNVYYQNQSSIKNYYFSVNDNDNTNIYSLKLNETAYIKLRDYSDGSEITDGQILTVLCHSKNKIIDKIIGSPNGTPVTFTEDCIYNVRVIGAYFDGKYIYPITYGADINYDYSEKTLDFDISFDKDSYLPGDEVKAEIKVTDKDGNPKKTLVNISVVDESVFAEYENNANLPGGFYSSVYNYIYYEFYASYTQHEFLSQGGGAEMGGGGGDDYDMRKDFTDNPAFISIETDESGVAKLSFKLAEQITSWRVTVHGITEDNYVGNLKKNIISSMPFSVDIVMNNEYISGDEIAFIVKPQGTQYKYNQTNVTYTVEILSGGNVIASDTGRSKGNFAFNAGKLPEGNYTVSVKAETGNLRDGIEKEFSVIKSGVLLALNAKDIISESSQDMRAYDIKTSPVTVTIRNSDMDFIMNMLYSCVSYSSNSKRTDYNAAANFSRKFIDSIYNKEPLNISRADYYGFDVGPANGKSELLYGSPDVLYTARFTACFPESFTENDLIQLRNYIYNECLLYENNIKSLKNMTPEFTDNEYLELNRAAGYLTLAAIGDTVLLDIYEQINIIYNSQNQDKFTESYQSHMRVLYYAAALCAMGDDNKAIELIEKYNDISDGLYDSDKATGDMQREYIETMTLYINTRIDPDEAYKYLKEKSDKKHENIYVSDVCEKINFVRYFTFDQNGTRSEIEYTLDGVTKREVFENYDMTELILTKEQFDELNIKYISGNTAVNLAFYGSPDNLDADKNTISITKRILSRDEILLSSGDFGGNVNINADESMNYIVLKINLPTGGYYSIRDRLPGNMRYTESNNDSNYNNGNNNYYYVSNPEKQFIDISVYTRHGGEITIIYNAVKISEAESVTEKAYVSRNFDIDEIWGASK